MRFGAGHRSGLCLRSGLFSRSGRLHPGTSRKQARSKAQSVFASPHYMKNAIRRWSPIWIVPSIGPVFSKWTTPSWHFEKTGPIEGTIRLRITPLHEKCDPALVTDLLTFMSKFGALGARAQMGFGVVKIIDGESNGDALYDLLKRPRENEPSHGMPALHQMFFARVSLSTGAALTDQETFLLKCDIRRLFTDANLRHEIMGWVKPNSDTRSGAKIHMSRPYNGSSALRLWGWITGEQADGRTIDRERAVLQPLYTYLNPSPPNTPGPFKLDSWMEWNSTRDRRPAIESRLDFFDRLRKETWQ